MHEFWSPEYKAKQKEKRTRNLTLAICETLAGYEDNTIDEALLRVKEIRKYLNKEIKIEPLPTRIKMSPKRIK
jgi:hypothetical protein